MFFLLVLCPAIASRALGKERTPIFSFPTTGVAFDASFEGARLDECILGDDGVYRITIRPENEPINNSAWYAFRVSSKSPQTLKIQLIYEGGKHRYHPKISEDGKKWQRLAGNRYQADGDRVRLLVEAGSQPIWIAAQEMLGVVELNQWMDELEDLPFVEETVIGRSVGNRPIRQLSIGTGEPKYAVAIVGRQHPPEVTGSMALMEFVETLTRASGLAEEYRRSFKTIVIPLMNPDGVAAGNWRHNLNGIDLNRDWGPFKQPETQTVRDAILLLREGGAPRLAFFLDFHSTQHDVFYVQTGEKPVWPEDFPPRWLDALAASMPEYKIRQEPNSSTRPLSKVWARKTMEVPAVIYEVGDNTDRELIRRVARTAAEAMMRLLLAEIDPASNESAEAVEAVLLPQ